MEEQDPLLDEFRSNIHSSSIEGDEDIESWYIRNSEELIEEGLETISIWSEPDPIEPEAFSKLLGITLALNEQASRNTRGNDAYLEGVFKGVFAAFQIGGLYPAK